MALIAATILFLIGALLVWSGLFAVRDPKEWLRWHSRLFGADLLARYRAKQSASYQAAGLYFLIVGSLFSIFGVRLIWRNVLAATQGELLDPLMGVISAGGGLYGFLLLAAPEWTVRSLSRATLSAQRKPAMKTLRVIGAVLVMAFGGALLFGAMSR